MKTTLICLLSLLTLNVFGQNLQPTSTAAFSYDLNPTDMTYANLKKIFLKPISEKDFRLWHGMANSTNHESYRPDIYQGPAHSYARGKGSQ